MHNLHGIFSLMLIKVAVLTALVYLFFTSTAIGSTYLILIIAASLTILYAYCAKCAARDQHCSHVLPGKFIRWLPQRESGLYRSADLLLTGGSLALIFIFPQYWLWQNTAVFIIFWALVVVALTEILLRVCPQCHNHDCMLCKKSR